MDENELSHRVIGLCIKIHRNLGPGLLESAYEEVMCYELTKSGLRYERQIGLPLVYQGVQMNMAYRLDVVVENKLVLELKSVEQLLPINFKQLHTYLKLADIRLGLLINFNEALIKNGIHRVVNAL